MFKNSSGDEKTLGQLTLSHQQSETSMSEKLDLGSSIVCFGFEFSSINKFSHCEKPIHNHNQGEFQRSGIAE